jgi:hypothetical protein
MLVTAGGAALASIVLRRAAGPSGPPAFQGATGVPMAIVPWGVLLEETRVLRWAAVERVQVDMLHASDGGNTATLWSFVTVETARERFSGRAPGAVPLDRLVAHVDGYAREAACVTSLDLTGDAPSEGPFEPEFESLLTAARSFIAGPASRMGVGGYRSTTRASASPPAVETLRDVLRDRTPKPADPRAFAAIMAAELGARELAPELVALVQSPHALVAAVAKVAAQKLGVALGKVGALDEVAPFLMERDVESLNAWATSAA